MECYSRKSYDVIIEGCEEGQEEETSLDNPDGAQTQLMIDQHLPSQESWNRLHEVNFLFLQLALFPTYDLLLSSSEKISVGNSTLTEMLK